MMYHKSSYRNELLVQFTLGIGKPTSLQGKNTLKILETTTAPKIISKNHLNYLMKYLCKQK